MDLTTISLEVSEHIATITLDRPESLNAFNGAMAAEVAHAWRTIRDDDDVHVVVLQANGDKAFCTGLDVTDDPSWFMRDNVWNSFDPGVLLSPKLHHKVWKPLVVAVHGMAAGGGQYFLNEADIVICSDDATFFDPHASVGIVSALEPIGMLARGVNIGEVMRWALMGNEERITAETALRIGLVSEVVPRAQLRDRAREIAATIAARNPRAIQGTVRAVWESLDMTRSMALQNGLAYTLIGNEAAPHAKGERRPTTYR
ncbi:MAG TPA: enoyl-CoA hydratase/isomerase family protein [Acidimicrobiales bacterium]|nr:enoyl-CoA hydratase/isomerase family protein [Acidimicrobiales bacterium]